MKASQIIKRYAIGERDFRKVNLRGLSFQGADLSGADFSGADIRGTNFKNATLRETKFCEAKAGLQRCSTFILVAASGIMSAIAGYILVLAGVLFSSIFYSSLQDQILGWAFLGALIVIFAVTISQGIGGVGAVVVRAVVFAFVGSLAVAVALGEDFTSYLPAYLILFLFFFTFAEVFARVVAVVGAEAFAFALVGAFTVVGAFAFALVGAFAVVGAFTVARAVAFAGLLVSTYLGWRAMKGDPRYVWVRTIAVAFASTGGTTFYNADLTDADFTGATLKNTDLRAKNLTRTCFKDTKKLIQARVGKTIFADFKVREL